MLHKPDFFPESLNGVHPILRSLNDISSVMFVILGLCLGWKGQ